MAESMLPPIHPGGHLREEYLIPLKISAILIADRLGMRRNEIAVVRVQ